MIQKLYVTKDISLLPKESIIDAMNILKWQLSDDSLERSEGDEANYFICSYSCYQSYFKSLRSKDKRFYVVFDSDEQFLEALDDLHPTKPYRWEWKNKDNGYEVTSKGDRRFSPFFMMMQSNDERYKGLITLESYYQLFIKGYINEGYRNPFEVKGMPPLHPELLPGSAHRLFGDYLFTHKGLFYELAVIGKQYSFTDMFDKNGGQNKTYADLLNKYYNL